MPRVHQGLSLQLLPAVLLLVAGCASRPPEVTPPPEPYTRPAPLADKNRPDCAQGEERAGDRCVPKLAAGELGPEGCPKDMVPIPSEVFLFGSPDPKYQNGLRDVRGLAVCMERTEVTVADYEACAKAGRCPPASSSVWNGEARSEEGDEALCNAGHAERQAHPMNCLTLTMAEAYCWSKGRRLPSELEWEHAARGRDGREYPWGSDNPGPRLVNACDRDCRALGEKRGLKLDTIQRETDGFAATAPAGTFGAGASPYGLLDLAGNVAEWTNSLFCPNAAETCRSKLRVVRGGSWSTGRAIQLGAASRDPRDPGNRTPSIGFRCARSPVSSPAGG
jgi:formylglycine-generating enzyme required for sulfatase activity